MSKKKTKQKDPADSGILDFATLREALDLTNRTEPGQPRPEARGIPSIEAAAKGGDGKTRSTLYILDSISYWTGNDALTIKDKLDDLKADVLDVVISSPGGSVFEGITIYNLLRSHSAEIHVHIHGLAGSIASVIALAGDKISIADNAMIFIHDASGGAWGRAEDLLKVAAWLEKINESITNTYDDRTNMGREKIVEHMSAETFYTAKEALDFGFVDEIVKPVAMAAHWSPETCRLPDGLADKLPGNIPDDPEPELSDMTPEKISEFEASLPVL